MKMVLGLSFKLKDCDKYLMFDVVLDVWLEVVCYVYVYFFFSGCMLFDCVFEDW